MSLFGWLTLSASILCVSLGVIVYSFNRRALLNKIFVVTSFFAFFYAFTEVMMWQSSSFNDASFWSKMGSIWPFFVVLVLHFALVFTKSNWLKNKLTYLVLYVPAFSLWIIDLLTHTINSVPVLEYWGFEDNSAGTLVAGVSTIWAAVLPVIAFAVCFQYYRLAVDEKQKQQRKFVTIGFSIPIFTYIVTNMLFRSLAIEVPNFGHFAVLFFSIFVGYAILKYELFTFDAAIVAENIVFTMPDSLVLTDMEGNMLKVNKRLVDFLGYKEEELIGKSITNLCVEEKQCSDTLKEVAEKKVMRNQELTYKTKLGKEKSVMFSGSIIRSKTGRDVGITCIIHDITERKKMEERLVKAEKLASIGELAGQIGHDLRNPLTGIKTAVYFLNKKGKDLTEADRKRILGIIDNAVEDSNRIINGLIEYSGNIHLEISTCTPQSLFSSALLKVQIPDRIEVINHLQDEPVISGDVSKMESVFSKIILNAVEAMPEKGTLELRSAQKGSNVEITFADTGIGINADVLPKIFSPLTTTKAKGMGLGLAICKRIVEAHEGKITVESTRGKGTTLTVTLPIKPKLEFAIAEDWIETELLQ